MVKIVKAIDEFSTGDSTQDKDLYFNPLIFDYAKEKKLPLIEVLQVLQGRESIKVDDFTRMSRLDLVNEIFDEEVTEYINMPGITKPYTTSEYNGVGNCLASDNVFIEIRWYG